MPKVGDVFRVEKEYTSTGNNAKQRWFIYLGKVSVFQNPQNIFLCTTTTNLSLYSDLPKNTIVYFSQGNGLFTENCLIYLKTIKTEFTQEKFDEYDPIFKGNIGKDKLHEIITKLKTAGIAQRLLQDILNSYRLDGIPTD